MLFNQLEEGGKDIRYTIRFPYELDWLTREVTDDFTSSFIRQDRSASSFLTLNGFPPPPPPPPLSLQPIHGEWLHTATESIGGEHH